MFLDSDLFFFFYSCNPIFVSHRIQVCSFLGAVWVRVHLLLSSCRHLTFRLANDSLTHVGTHGVFMALMLLPWPLHSLPFSGPQFFPANDDKHRESWDNIDLFQRKRFSFAARLKGNRHIFLEYFTFF